MPLPHIENYQFGKIIIDGQVHTKDVIILPTRVIGQWWREHGHLLQLPDIHEIIDSDLQILIIGQGASGQMRISDEVFTALESRGIDLIALNTREACNEYNRVSQTKKVAAALHLTC
ncbi:MAG: hypothetical protein JSV42_13155 [Chloroflexota bacterium]|nr:MAG: hypothetical protein JSV42_13155 [Chloroflexota bacterium]